jgi:excisionase family DNA binding protein
MINSIHQNRRSREDRHKKSDRRSGFDRRQNGNGDRAGSEDPNGQDDIFTTKDACQYLKISRPTYMKYIASGKIKAKKVGRGWRALQSELKRFLCEE